MTAPVVAHENGLYPDKISIYMVSITLAESEVKLSYDTAEGIRRSDLWVINKSPFHFKYYMDHKDEKSTKALTFGAAAHKWILEPNTFGLEFAIAPEVNRRTKDGKEEWATFETRCSEKNLSIITADELGTILNMAAVLQENPFAWQLLRGEHEKEYYWTDDLTREKCKCKVDCITEYNGKPYIVDYKTTDSCEDGHFERSARKYGYQFQAGMYCEGVFQNELEEYGFAFVAQEKTAPYAVRVYLCDPEWIKRGYDKFRELIGIYHECNVSGNWYGYEGPDGIPVELVEE